MGETGGNRDVIVCGRGEQGDGEAAMSSATTPSSEESIGSCRPPTPPTPSPPPPAPAVPCGTPSVRRQLDFTGGGGGLDDDDFLFRAVDDIERGYSEAKRRAPPCVCGRGVCAVERDDQRGRWMYVCSSRPKCKHVAFCEEVDLIPKSQPASRNHPKPSNLCAFNDPSNHMSDCRTPISFSLGVDATVPVNVHPQVAGAPTPVNVRPQVAGASATKLFNLSSQGAGASTPVNVSPQGAGATALVKVSSQGVSSSGEQPICLCKAGRCKKSRVNNEEFYVCHIPKGKGACSHLVPVKAAVKEPPQTGGANTRVDKHLNINPVEKDVHGNNLVQVGDNNANGSVNPVQPEGDEWPFDIVNNEIVITAQATTCEQVRQESPSMLHRFATVKTPTESPMPPHGTCSPITPTKSPMPSYGTRSPITPSSNDICYRCGDKGHWSKDCPKPSPCFQCGMVGHWKTNCPQLRGS